jgi:hypothetical protein
MNERKPAAPSTTPPLRAITNPQKLKVMSAERQQPLPTEKPALTRERLKEGAAETVLNSLAILREAHESFRRANRFSKYKAGIIAAWLALSVTSAMVACPSSETANRIRAQLVTSEVAGRAVVSVRNESKQTWRHVLVVVNGLYRATTPPVEPGTMLTVTPKLLSTREGTPAPPQLKVVDLEVQTSEGRATLLRGGNKP